MTIQQRTTLTQFLIEERRRFPSASGDFNALILDVALACKAIAKAVAFGELGGMYGNQAADEGDSINVQGETQKKLDFFIKNIDLATFEFENIPFQTLDYVEKKITVSPKPSIIRILQDISILICIAR